MNYNMSSPCTHCPFRNDITGYLTTARVREITRSVLAQESFPCHKTTTFADTDDDTDQRTNTDDEEQCAGAEIFAAHHGVSSQMSRIVSRLGFKVAELDMDAPVCTSVREMLRVHSDCRT